MGQGSHSYIALLVSMASMVAAGCGPGEAGDGETSSTSEDGGETGGAEETSSSESETGMAETGSTETGTPMDTGDTASFVPTDDTGDGDSAGDGDGTPVCVDFGQTLGDCFGATYGGYFQMQCEGYMAYASYIGTDCVTAMEDWYACLSQLDCMEFSDTGDDPCSIVHGPLADAACGWGDGDGDGDGDGAPPP